MEIAQAGKTHAIDQGIAADRADRLDAVIHRARAGAEPQLFRRVLRDGGIEDDRARHHHRVVEDLLQLAAGVGHQRAGIILAARQRARDRDHADFRVAKPAKTPLRRGLETVEPVLIEDLVLHAHQDDLCRIHHRAATDRDDEVGAGLLRFASDLHHRFARGVLRNAVEGRGTSLAKRLPYPLDFVGLGVQRPACDQENAARVQPLGLLAQRLGRGLAIDDLIHRRELVAACGPHVLLRW